MLTNSKIKEFKSLQQKRCREREKLFLAEGLKIINETISTHPELIDLVLYTSESESKLKISSDINAIKVNQETINRISALKTPQSCLGILKILPHDNLKIQRDDDLVLVLDSIKDPGNMGTIIRLSDWFGISKIICSTDCVDCYNPKVVQATMGAFLRVKIYYEELPEFLAKNKTDNLLVYGATLEGENIYETKIKFPSILIMGSESEGISPKIKPFLTKELSIPNFSIKNEKTESLNVSTATSIILSEFRRVQNYSK